MPGMAHIVFITSGLEHLGVAALSAYLREHGHQTSMVYEPKPFSSNSGPDNPLLAKLLEPSPELTAQRILAKKPDIVAFSSYTVTHKWSVDVARAVKRQRNVPIVFGGAHVSGAPQHAIREEAIDVVVEGEGEGALLDLAECVEKEGFGRQDIPNTWLRGDKGIIRNPLRPLIADLDTLPWADKSGFYSHIPVFEREFYVISRRGCPFRCSFCEYSIFPRQYPGSKPVRRRSVEHLMGELRAWHARGVMRKIFFWDAIFTLDLGWMEEFAEAYSRDIGLPFECYSHPQAMSRDMARILKDAGCAMIRIGVQTVNPETLAEMERKGDAEKVQSAIRHLKDYDIDHSVDHIAGLPGEGLEDQKNAIRFYNELRPAQVYVHWMTYLPGTTAFDRARADGSIPAETAEKILMGEENRGFDAPRMLHAGGKQEEFDEISRVIVLFDLLPMLSRKKIEWLLDSGLYRKLPQGVGVRQILRLVLAFVGDVALRERMRTILLGSLQSAAKELPIPDFFQNTSPSSEEHQNWPTRPQPALNSDADSDTNSDTSSEASPGAGVERKEPKLVELRLF